MVVLSGHGDQGYESLDGLVKVWGELTLGSMGSGTDSTSDGDLDGYGSSLEQDKKSLHEQSEVVDDIVTENLEVRVETCAGVLLSRIVDNEVEQDGDNGLVSGRALFGQPLA